MKYFRRELEIKDRYDDLQLDDVLLWNSEVKKLNELYDFLNNETYNSGDKIREANRQIDIQIKYMKNIKPNWINSNTK